jgi:chitin synthase
VLLSPTYFNVLNIYAFGLSRLLSPCSLALTTSSANLDDISWGTKGETAVSDDLGTVKQNALAQVDVEVLAEPADIDAVYADSLKSLRARKFDSLPKPEPAMRTLAERESDAKD